MAATKKTAEKTKPAETVRRTPAKKTVPAETAKAKASAAAKPERAAKKSAAAGTPAKTPAKKSAAPKKPATAAKKKAPARRKKDAPAENPAAGIGLVRRCVAALEEKKAANIEVIFLGEKSPVTDYFVIATGTSDPHLRALRIELEKAVRDVVPAAHVRVQNEPNSGWCVVDAFDVVVHIFSEDRRRTYALEELWKDGERIEL